MKTEIGVALVFWVCVCVACVAEEKTNTPDRLTISQFSPPPMDRIVVTSTNMIARIMSAFPGYEGQPAEAFTRGHWPVEYIVDVSFPDGRKRAIYVKENSWTAGGKYTPLTLKWDDLLQSMTTMFFKRDWGNMQRLSEVHEPTTLIVGPYNATDGLPGQQPRGEYSPPAPRSSKPTP